MGQIPRHHSMSGPEDLKLGGKYNAGNPAGRRVMTDKQDPPTSAEPVAFVIGWHVETGTTALHPFVRLDIRYFPGQPKLKVGDKIYAHLPTSEWNDAIQDVLNLACSRRWDMEELVEAIRGLKR